MKKGIHPESYRLVAFKDMSNEHVFITRSCVNTRETIDIEGVTYPLVKVEISNTSRTPPAAWTSSISVTRTVRSNTLHQDTSEPHSITDWVRLFHARCLHPRGKCRAFRRKRFTFPWGMRLQGRSSRTCFGKCLVYRHSEKGHLLDLG